ncbi:MAG: 3-hydroxy-3-isohexenylglutaryl-CoA/hydroxy-methylglutaryl-CoA lyase [Turneriella sp.]|nr:3-hydroxy-3-isohexenylglutaryl-CoA/hydroxy-methylglutaryl-CoA lyase [Turneriella sp.]
MSQYPLEICEVAPRDGLQSASKILTVDERVRFIENLLSHGLTKIEVGSIVNPRLVPTMADSDAVYTKLLQKHPANQENFSLLVPNEKGLTRAKEIGCTYVALFTATSETFNKKNINRSVSESINDIAHLIQSARGHGMRIRLYISTVFDCAYEGTKNPEADLPRFASLFADADEISLGDTTGKASLVQLTQLIQSGFLKPWHEKIWWHFHDTYQRAEANVRYALEANFRRFDSSAGGIGGCPFSPGAKGNISTEKVVALAEALNIPHSIHLPLENTITGVL